MTPPNNQEVKVLPKIELPTEQDYIKADKFYGFDNAVYTDEQRKKISELAYKIMLRRKTIQ